MAKRAQTKKRKKTGKKTDFHDEMEELLRERQRQSHTTLKLKKARK